MAFQLPVRMEDIKKHMEETAEYWRRVSESEGFDIEGIPPPRGTNAMMSCVCRTMAVRYPYMALVNRYARLGIHRYNMSQKFNYTMNYLIFYYITVEAREPGSNSETTTFQIGVAEQSFGDLNLKCFIARPKGTPKTSEQPYQLHDIAPKDDELPHWPSDSDFNDTRFYEVKESELESNDWILLYLELAICANDSLIPARTLSPLKIVKVFIETSEDVKANERLQAKSANLYITFKGLAMARVGEIGEHVERKIIVRRVIDELTGDLTLLGGFGFKIGEVVEMRPMTAPSLENIPSLKNIPKSEFRRMKRSRRPPLDLSVVTNLRSFYEEHSKK